MKPFKILNLYACLGGNRYYWDEVGELLGVKIKVTAVELDAKLAELYQNRFPNDVVVVTDAHQYLLEHYKEFDFIWSSPPCPSHSKMVLATKHDIACYPDFSLYEEIVFLNTFYEGKYVVENVISYYQPLMPPQKINRHYYWANFKIPRINIEPMKNFSKASRKQVAEWLGFDYEGKNIYIKENHDPAQVLRNCIHPIEGKTIFETALGVIRKSDTKQIELTL